ncbi:probable glycosyltransferase At5g03795 [Macadamia integrifolia]|uniref:probable glycosyltransferase At5g03795 n=1 Tax=Macadamia integrifolia TaxID=60698 RepID=UPI001C53334D|nr:probable glycosyltransferase At5g03795 [Macadamia integrifolia]
MADYSNLSSCWTSVSSSLKFLLVVVTLILLSGFVLMLGPKIPRVPSSYNPWVWRADSSSFSSPATTAMTTTASSLEAEEETERHLDFHPTVVDALSTEIQEPLSRHPTFNSSSSPSPPPDSQIIQNQEPAPQPDEETQEHTKASKNESNVSPLITKMPKEYSRLERLEARLARTRAAIREAAWSWNQTVPDQDYVPQGPMYWKPRAFHRSYLEMEKHFKVFIYEEGEAPLFHNGPCKSIYSMEGNFIHRMEIDSQIRTRDPEKAHMFFLPFSVTMMVRFVYVSNSHDSGPIKRTVRDYVDVISKKYPFWNRSLGADHFMLSCHDWGPMSSTFVPNMFKNSIRVLCNANTSEGFNPTKDAALPEIHLKTGFMKGIGGPSPSRRPILGFFAGGMHGPVRPVLLQHWKNKDDDLQVFEYLPKGISYEDKMRKSRFCLCPSGYEVASPRIVEAIYAGCVPVLINDHYVPPFSDVLNWKSFSVEVPVREIPNLKKILMSISSGQYIRMQRRLIQVRRHFEVHSPPKRFDVYHMILHSVWLRRLNIRIRDS